MRNKGDNYMEGTAKIRVSWLEGEKNIKYVHHYGPLRGVCLDLYKCRSFSSKCQGLKTSYTRLH